MRRNLATVHTKSSAQEIAEIMRKEDVAFVAIVDEQGRLLGLVTDRDIVVRGIAGRGSLEGLKAEDLSSTDVETASPETPVHEILQRMGAEHIRPALVVDGEGRLLGQLSIGDIAKRADQDEQLQEAFAQLSGRRSFWNRLWR